MLRRASLIGLALAAVLLVCVACAEKQKPQVRPRAQPRGIGLFIADPAVSTAAGTSCAPAITEGIAPRFRSAATTALSEAGFKIADAEEGAAFVAGLSLEVDYCSDAGIVSGTTALDLKRARAASVWRGQATGDQARGETAVSTLRELVEQMLYDDGVIQATAQAH